MLYLSKTEWRASLLVENRLWHSFVQSISSLNDYQLLILSTKNMTFLRRRVAPSVKDWSGYSSWAVRRNTSMNSFLQSSFESFWESLLEVSIPPPLKFLSV